MNKPEGKLRRGLAKPFLLALLVCTPLSATLCRAQCNVLGPQWSSINSVTMTPSVWTAGQTYTVTVTESNPQEGYFRRDILFRVPVLLMSTYEENLTGPDSNNYLTYWRGDGSSWSFSYNSALHSYTLASPPNVCAQLVSNPSGGFTLTLADGTQRVFNSQNLLAALIDRNGNQTTVAHDSSSRISSVASPGGSTLTFTYGNSTCPMQATKAQDAVGTVATYTYDSSCRLALVSYPDGSALNFNYDPDSSMILSVTDSQGKLLEAHTYDTQNRGLTSTRANGVDAVSLSY